jgi:hypothetical protein
VPQGMRAWCAAAMRAWVGSYCHRDCWIIIRHTSRDKVGYPQPVCTLQFLPCVRAGGLWQPDHQVSILCTA